jgi:hypothetical protein
VYEYNYRPSAAAEHDAALHNALHDATGAEITNIESSTTHDKETCTKDDMMIQQYNRNDEDEFERTSPPGIKFWWRNEHDELEECDELELRSRKLRSRKTSNSETDRIEPNDSRECTPNQFRDKSPNELVHTGGLPSERIALDDKRIDAKPKAELHLSAQWDAFFQFDRAAYERGLNRNSICLTTNRNLTLASS